jgi:sulfite reductase alpha subunit-like flavoprotein
MCDLILENDAYKGKFKGLKYALLGLGDSKYTTFFLNPTALDSAMSKAGAERVGSLGKADASGTGDKVQLSVIEDWSKNIIMDLKRVVKELDGLDGAEWDKKEEELEIVRNNTGDLCKLIYEDWDENEKAKTDGAKNNIFTMMLPLAIAIILGLYLRYS